MKLAGRHQEIALLEDLLLQDSPEFVAVYGRRRVGKTYLIRETYKKQIVFECAGLHKKTFSQQLENFWLTLQEYNSSTPPTLPPTTWLQAFSQLKIYLNTLKGDEKKVIFLDEIPWFETAKSGFLAALDNFWNQYCSKRSDLILVICGSAASWIIRKVINDRGGLHNRITTHIQLMPFTLRETKDYLEMKGIQLTLKDIVQLYMCIGGIPFYLKDVKVGKSIPQILDDLFFKNQASLKREFSNLYASLFKNSDAHEQIVAALSTKNKGLTRTELVRITGLKSGGGLTLLLTELIECGFVKTLLPINQKNADRLFRLVDEYSLFYFKFLANQKTNSSWQQISATPTYKIWSGYAFENVCLKHIKSIKNALGISGIITNNYSWFQKNNEYSAGAQIDLIVDRADNCINIFELKFHNKELEITKNYTDQLRNKVEIFKQQTKTQKNVFLTFLTVFGVKKNKHYLSLGSNQLDIKDLFLA